MGYLHHDNLAVYLYSDTLPTGLRLRGSFRLAYCILRVGYNVLYRHSFVVFDVLHGLVLEARSEEALEDCS